MMMMMMLLMMMIDGLIEGTNKRNQGLKTDMPNCAKLEAQEARAMHSIR